MVAGKPGVGGYRWFLSIRHPATLTAPPAVGVMDA